MLLSGLKTLLVVLGLRGNGQDRDGGDTLSPVTSVMRPPETSDGHQGPAQSLGLKYQDLVPSRRDLFECSKNLYKMN